VPLPPSTVIWYQRMVKYIYLPIPNYLPSLAAWKATVGLASHWLKAWKRETSTPALSCGAWLTLPKHKHKKDFPGELG